VRGLFFILLFIVTVPAFGNRIEAGKNKPVPSIKQAISLAQPGDTILLYPGIYREGPLLITKSINLIGVDWPVLDGEKKFEILTVSGTDILIKGLHFLNAGYSSMNDYAALKIIEGYNIRVIGNKFSHAFFGIHIANSTHSVIANNTLLGTKKSEHLSGNGIHLWKCESMLIENNSVEGHRDGIYFEFVTKSVIRDNLSEKNIRYGLHFMFSNNDTYTGNTFRNNGAGVAVMYTKNVRMENNLFERNWGSSAYGILLKDISDSRIIHNRFIQNTIAIHMEGSSRIEIDKNSFTRNGWGLKVQASCDDNKFHHNNFSGNSFDVATNGMKALNTFYQNYWDRYEGYDLNRDGFGDVPYHPVSMYSMIVEQNPTTLMLMKSFIITLLDKAERAIPSLTPEDLVDTRPMIKPNKL
jgi:nitrous oxidase accessory protein